MQSTETKVKAAQQFSSQKHAATYFAPASTWSSDVSAPKLYSAHSTVTLLLLEEVAEDDVEAAGKPTRASRSGAAAAAAGGAVDVPAAAAAAGAAGAVDAPAAAAAALTMSSKLPYACTSTAKSGSRPQQASTSPSSVLASTVCEASRLAVGTGRRCLGRPAIMLRGRAMTLKAYSPAGTSRPCAAAAAEAAAVTRTCHTLAGALASCTKETLQQQMQQDPQLPVGGGLADGHGDSAAPER